VVKKPVSTLKSIAESITSSTGRKIRKYNLYNIHGRERLLFGTVVGAKNSAIQYTDIQKKKHSGLKLAFKDGVNTSRKVSGAQVSKFACKQDILKLRQGIIHIFGGH
jgi:hypothetical protein